MTTSVEHRLQAIMAAGQHHTNVLFAVRALDGPTDDFRFIPGDVIGTFLTGDHEYHCIGENCAQSIETFLKAQQKPGKRV